MIILDWNEAKRLRNLAKHGVDFSDLLELFENETSTEFDDRFDYGEDRFLTLGLFRGEVLAISHTEAVVGENTEVRIISARKAERHEQEYYFKNVRD